MDESEMRSEQYPKSQWWGGVGETGGSLLVLALVRIERGQQAACVEQDHSPKPRASSSSTRSASVESPLLNSGKRGGG